MLMPTVRYTYDRLPAALATILFHVAIVAVLLNTIPKYIVHKAQEPETIVALTPQRSAPLRAKLRAAPGMKALYRYYYNFSPAPSAAQPNLQGLSLALSSCAPENYGNESEEVRAACRRIGMAVAANPEAFGLAPDYKNGKRWERELLIKQTPLLLPCASPNSSALNIVNLATLLCMSDIVLNGYDPGKMQHYSK
ncbi:MAG: hypothetical protein WCA78_15910 [Rhizomicrobium sp.]